MNILFIAYNINIHSRTGDAVHVRELVLNLALLRNKVTLIVGFDADSKEDISVLENNPNINIFYVKNSRYKYPRSKDISILSLCLNVDKKLHHNIIYERSYSCRIGAILSKILRIPLIVEINGLIEEEMIIQGKNTSLSKKFLGKKLRRLFFMQTSKIVAVTPGIKKEISKQYRIPPYKIVIVSNGADIDHFKPMDKDNVKRELKLSLQSKYICFVGNLAPWQGVDNLIKAVPLVVEKIPEVKFLIVGDGIMREKLEQMAKDLGVGRHLLFIGFVPFNIVPMYINASDVCVVPKKILKSGYSPLKLYEYMSCGKPVIATKTDGFEIVEQYGAGVLIDPENSEAFSKAICDFIINEELLSQHSENVRRIIIQEYSWAKTAEKILEICRVSIK